MMLVSCGDSGVAIQTGDTSDTDSYQNTTNDSQTTQENTTDVTPQPDKVNMSSPSESEMSKIYERAVAAKENKEYQYSYALFSYLATKGYRDSVSQAADGRMLGLAEKIATTGLANVAGGENCSVSGISDDDFTEGYLYIAEGGVPTFVYLSGGETVSIIPDSTLKDVVSIVKFITPYYEFFVCLKNDGTLSAIYNPAVCDDESGAAQTFNSLLAFLSSQKNVVQVSAGDDFECAVLLSDGTLSLFCLPQFHLGYSENIDRVKNWRDVAYISFGRYSALGVKNNGEVLCEKLSYSSYSQGELSAYQNLIDNNITLQAVQGIINDGKLYLRYPDKKATYSVEDGK
ncbi:MAG: hypothetical protein IJE84_06045, partial [Clostridia bacterium]|nr:hypothetical protein [Clostridia bacterium]